MRIVILAAAMALAPIVASAQDTGQGVIERLEEYDIQVGPNGEVETCGVLPAKAPAGAARPVVEAATEAALEHVSCINDHSMQVQQQTLELMQWVSQRASLVTPALEPAAMAQIERIDGRIDALKSWQKAYFCDRARPVVQDGNQRLGLSNDPLGSYCTT